MAGWRWLVLGVALLLAMPVWSWGAALVSSADSVAVLEGAAMLVGLVVGMVCLVRFLYK